MHLSNIIKTVEFARGDYLNKFERSITNRNNRTQSNGNNSIYFRLYSIIEQ